MCSRSTPISVVVRAQRKDQQQTVWRHGRPPRPALHSRHIATRLCSEYNRASDTSSAYPSRNEAGTAEARWGRSAARCRRRRCILRKLNGEDETGRAAGASGRRRFRPDGDPFDDEDFVELDNIAVRGSVGQREPLVKPSPSRAWHRPCIRRGRSPTLGRRAIPGRAVLRGIRLFVVVTASGADDDVLADAYHSESLRAYVLRPAFVVRSAFDLGGKSVRSGSGSTSSASTTGAASPPPSKAGVCHSCNSSSGTPRCARDSARPPLVMSSKMTSNGHDPYRIAIGLLPSPVSCGNKPDRMGALSAGAQFGQHRVTDRRLCLHEAADRTDRAYHPGVHSAPA